MNQSKRTVGQKLWFMCGLLIVNMTVVGGLGLWESDRIVKHLNKVAEVDLPAVRTMTLADMVHDALRANAYFAIINSGTKDKEVIKEVSDEYAELSKNISEYLKTLQGMEGLDAQVRENIGQATGNLDAYVKAAGVILELSLAGKTVEALNKIPDFQKAFTTLEKDLEVIGANIEKSADEDRKKSTEESRSAFLINSALVIFGIIVGLLNSWWSIRGLVRTLREMTATIGNASDLLSSYTDQISAVSKSLNSSTTQQASAVQETASSLEEINAMVTRTSENSSQLSKTVEKSTQSASQGQGSVDQMLQAMKTINTSNSEIKTQIETSNNQIAEIVKVINEIGEKTKVINDIVFQTKLLSFNASVEAARAGEHGKGFAVVAEEVGNLAQMSGNASKEIFSMLNEGTEKVNSIVSQTKERVERLMSDGAEKVRVGSETASDCGKSLQAIVSQVSEVNTMTGEIARAIGEQTQGLNEITKAVNLFNESTQKNASIANESFKVSEQLLDQSKVLSGVLAQLQSLVGNSSIKNTRGEVPVKNDSDQSFSHDEHDDSGFKQVA